MILLYSQRDIYTHTHKEENSDLLARRREVEVYLETEYNLTLILNCQSHKRNKLKSRKSSWTLKQLKKKEDSIDFSKW